jgi:hypothetical protein
LPEVGGVIPEAQGIASGAGGVSPEAGSVTPGACGGSPEAGGGLPEADSVTPEAGGALPEADSVTPEVGGDLPEACGGLPGAGGGLPVAGSVTPEAGGGLPEAGGVKPDARAVTQGAAPFDGVFMNWQVLYNADPSLQAMKEIPRYWRLDDLEYLPGDLPDLERPATVEGSIIITPHLPHILQAELRKAAARAPGAHAERLLGLARTAAKLNVKSQRLAGFYDALLTRKPALALPVTNYAPEVWDYASYVANLIGEQYDYLPMPDMPLNHLGGGLFRLNQLAIADEYGRLYAPEYPNAHLPPEYATKHFGVMALPPRLAEPYRVNARLRCPLEKGDVEESCFDTVSPLLCWLVPDRVNRALLLYAPEGDYLGEVKQGEDGLAVLEPSPLEGAPPLEGALAALVAALTKTKGALGALFDCVEVCPGVIGSGGGLLSSLALFYGKPLALARLSLGVEPLCTPARATGEEGPSPLGFTLPLVLGDRQHMNEGLVGFFQDATTGFERFYACAYPTGGTGEYASASNRADVAVSLDGAEETTVTLLLEPTSPVHIISGLLPVKTIAMPQNSLKTICDRARVFLRTGPIVSGEQPELPHWKRDHLMMRWLERMADGTLSQPKEPLQPDATMALFGDGILLKDGYLTAEQQ